MAGLIALTGCGDSTDVTSGAAIAPVRQVDDSPTDDLAGATYYLPVYSGSAKADSARSEREELAAESLEVWRSQADSPAMSREDLARSYGVAPEDLDKYMAGAADALSEAGLQPPDIDGLSPSTSSFFTETASVCGGPAAVALFPVAEGRVVALDQYAKVEPVAVAKEVGGVSAAWEASLSGGGRVVILTSVDVPEVSVSVAVTDPECHAASVLASVSVERGTR